MYYSVIVNYNTTGRRSISADRSPAEYAMPGTVQKTEENEMKSLRITLPVVLLSLSTVMAFAQSDAHKSSMAPVPSEAQKSFATMKSLAGEWEGPVAVPEMPAMSTASRSTSRCA